MKTYLELPHMLPIKVYESSDGESVWIEQPDADDDEADRVLIHLEQVEQVIAALQEFLASKVESA